MNLPFDQTRFLAVFREYNEAVWPLQVVLLLVGVAALVLAVRGSPRAGRVISFLLALLWAWMGAVYHVVFFMPINPAAGLFGALFLFAAAAFVWYGGLRERLHFKLKANARGWFALALGAYALIAYPLLGLAWGRDVPELVSFGLPCPTTLFTIGLLGLAQPTFPRAVLVVPLLWSLVALQAAWFLGIYEDFALAVAAAAGLWFALPPHWTRKLA
jgi:hypothetical protein